MPVLVIPSFGVVVQKEQRRGTVLVPYLGTLGHNLVVQLPVRLKVVNTQVVTWMDPISRQRTKKLMLAVFKLQT